MQRHALIFGATGAVGRELLGLCVEGDRYSKVLVIARRPRTIEHEKLHWIVSEFDALDRLQTDSGMDGGDAFCCLGTTIKAAGSKAAFRRVDHDFVLNAAEFALRCGVKRFSLVSSIGANAQSRSLYTRTKGEVEAALIAMKFRSLQIFRPSLLKGERDEFRLAESIGNSVAVLMKPLFFIGLRKYQPVAMSKLAKAIYDSADQEGADAVRVLESDEIQSY